MRTQALAEATQAASAAGRSVEFDTKGHLQKIAMTFLGMAAKEQRKEEPDDRWLRDLLLSAQKTLNDLMPYDHSRLASMEHKFPQFDLSRLTDAQLTALEGIVATASVEGSDPN